MGGGLQRALVVLALLPAAAAGQMSVTTFGKGEARACYLAASDPLSFELQVCEQALYNLPASFRDQLATRVNYAVMLNRAGRPDDALASLDHALRQDGRLAEAWVNRGNSLFLLDRLQEALADYEHALELEVSRSHRAWYNIGLVHERLGDREAAVAAWQTALATSPGFTLAEEKLRLAGRPVAAGQ